MGQEAEPQATVLGALTLSVVDQSPLRKGGTGADALTESVRLAQRCEQLGYARYWVAEHHASTSWTGASPEILIGQIAAGTSTIRVGSGGVMLSHYSALKVAEQFRALDAFHPGRIDLGVGRAPGSDQRTAFALAHPRQPADVRTFPRQVHDLLAFLSGEMAAEHPFAGISALAGPQPATGPEVWLLGSSDYQRAGSPPCWACRSRSRTSSATSSTDRWSRTCTAGSSSRRRTWTRPG